MIVRRLFSSKEKIAEKDKKKEENKSAAIGAGMVGASTVGNALLNNNLKKISKY